MPTQADLHFIIRECGSIARAIAYCERVARSNGPLTAWYVDAAARLSAREGR